MDKENIKLREEVKLLKEKIEKEKRDKESTDFYNSFKPGDIPYLF